MNFQPTRRDTERALGYLSGEDRFLAEQVFDEAVQRSDYVQIYFDQIGNFDLLTLEEECSLGEQIKAGEEADKELKLENLSDERRQELEIIKSNANDAYNLFFRSNTRLVISIAKRYQGRGVDFLDLIQEGNLGLDMALHKWDRHRGYKFSTYATYWIRQKITRGIADSGRTIRLPVHMGDQLGNFVKNINTLVQDLGRYPNFEEIVEYTGLAEKKVVLLSGVARSPISIDINLRGRKGDEGSLLGDIIPDETIRDPVEEIIGNERKQKVMEVMKEALDDREIEVLIHYHGFIDGKGAVLQEIAQYLNLTRERVRQIRNEAYKKLSNPKYLIILKEL